MMILVSGTPGTGKTSVSEILSERLGYRLVRINDFADEQGLTEGVDPVRGSRIIDEEKLKAKVGDLSGDIVLEGHLAHFCKGDVSVVLRARPDELERRLSLRKWIREKIRENVEAEMLDVILTEAVEANENVVEVDTTGKSPDDVCRILEDMIQNKRYDDFRPGKVSWMSYLEDSV
ncbi:MAG: adenylate kinase family protein [archaeon]|nr:adenylate kinase family protein [archaeon]